MLKLGISLSLEDFRKLTSKKLVIKKIDDADILGVVEVNFALADNITFGTMIEILKQNLDEAYGE